MGTHYKSLIESEYLGQWDLQRDGRLVDAVVQIEKVERFIPQKIQKKKVTDAAGKPVLDAHGKEQWKAAPNRRIKVSFRGKRKSWLAGPVTQEVIVKMFGPKIEDWIGKKVTLFVDPTVKMGRQVTGGIRVRLQRNGATGPLTEDALDNEVDPEIAAAIDAAKDPFVDEGEVAPEVSP
jgi:hypothetical protein